MVLGLVISTFGFKQLVVSGTLKSGVLKKMVAIKSDALPLGFLSD